ncbi:Choline/ethanolaminephosphotransferase [Auricularia subglabra TFB-10046 SS5]|nr:Choline/ethanolaminephosphotransferase [Auricularia subglabra TFB-10046 SS5]
MLDEPLLAPPLIKNLKFYKYSAVDKSPTTKYVLRHWWDLATKCFPMWIAPNLITLLGLGFVIANVVCQYIYDPQLLGTAPSWVYLTHALGLFLYQTFDNVDGRQARRTGSSSALGHAFDHTIDSLNCGLGGLLQAASMGLGSTKRGAIIALIGCWPMWFSTWEEYHTHTLYLGYINGPTEGLLIAVGVHLVSGLYGPQIWHTLLPVDKNEILGRFANSTEIELVDIFIGFVIFSSMIIHTPACFWHVKRRYGAHWEAFFGACMQNSFYILYNTLLVSWLFAQNSVVLQRGHLFEFSLLITFTFGTLGPRVILAYLTKGPFPEYNVGTFLPLVIGQFVVQVSRRLHVDSDKAALAELACLYIGMAFSCVNFILWWINVCQHFCAELDIWCLTIKPKAQKKVE